MKTRERRSPSWCFGGSLRPTALGLKAIAFLAVVLTAYFASSYANLFFLLVAFLVVTLAADVAWSFGNLRGARARVLEIEPAPAGRPIPVRVEYEALDRRAHFDLGVELRLGAGVRRAPRCGFVGAGETGVVAGCLGNLPRGVHRVAAAILESTWPLGMTRRIVAADAPAEIVVFPAPLADDDGAPLCAVGAGDRFLQRHRVAASDERSPSGLVEYRPGDAPRDVHWRATARRRALVVKTFEPHGAGLGVEVVLDRRAPHDAFDEALSVSSTLALRARDKKEPLHFHSQGLSGTFGGDRGAPIAELLRWLATVEPLAADAGAPPPAGPGAVRLPEHRDDRSSVSTPSGDTDRAEVTA